MLVIPEIKGMGRSQLFCFCLSMTLLFGSVSQSVPTFWVTNAPGCKLASKNTITVVSSVPVWINNIQKDNNNSCQFSKICE